MYIYINMLNSLMLNVIVYCLDLQVDLLDAKFSRLLKGMLHFLINDLM